MLNIIMILEVECKYELGGVHEDYQAGEYYSLEDMKLELQL
jgi:hypothetical protein